MSRTPVVALVGNPNAGKTSLFNALTGSRQKVGNYPGVTVERKAGRLALPDGRVCDLIDLPGTYSLTPRSPDEAVTRDAIFGRIAGEKPLDAIVAVIDATNLRNHLRFVLELKPLGLPLVVALNMVDLAARDGIVIDAARLSALIGLPVVETVAVRKRGLDALGRALAADIGDTPPALPIAAASDLKALQKQARQICAAVETSTGAARRWSQRIDAVALHPVAGPLLLAAILFFMFQAVFSWAEAPMGWIEAGIAALQADLAQRLPDGVLLSLINDGVLAGVGAVVVFLPQILILFAFIIALEQSGYMTRAAFLMDRLMARVGLNGRAFIPLLSSFACAIPGIMATRTIDSPRDRLTTILIAPLMTCSARLPVYAVVIGAFIPARDVGPFGLQGLVLFALYLAGILGALVAAFALRRTVTKGAAPPFLMEMPKYQWPAGRDMALGLYGRATAFLQRAGTIILASTIVLWGLASWPQPPADGNRPAIEYSLAGKIGEALEPIFAPIGFNKEIVFALVPGMAAREVAVSALGTVYALQGVDEEHADGLIAQLRAAWPLPTALAFLAWFVFAPQCISTLAITRRETASWRWPIFMFSYLFAAAYVAAGLTYHLAVAAGL
ncbi:ferrous iron transporter B [Sandarakinorhabdus cyanobacteriorum]|uniref:Ferrous iron transport protein B n=1 Tax=Sandarakinorhabdus cyanobacteriorum TaxID=1981098 RepID=A0A255YNF1_9SPHN|nr:ferrous iron transporter B [Sandarakinorhabdus cyanobacteriorum]OYQ30125.1 ferrous iron transporter B [Sandarakinorhabdus cyanobacteriorum]